jgi:hypothetical protein
MKEMVFTYHYKFQNPERYPDVFVDIVSSNYLSAKKKAMVLAYNMMFRNIEELGAMRI